MNKAYINWLLVLTFGAGFLTGYYGHKLKTKALQWKREFHEKALKKADKQLKGV